MILGLLDALGLDEVAVVGHDHGGAVAQLLAARHPERIGALVLCNVEAYDNWPSADERPLVRLTQVPVVGALLLKAYGTPRSTVCSCRSGRRSRTKMCSTTN